MTSTELRLHLARFNSPHMPGSFSLQSLAEGSEIISEAEEIEEVKVLQANAAKAAKGKHYEDAMKYYQDALDIDQQNTSVLLDRATTFVKMGCITKAKKDAEMVITINHTSSEGHKMLGLCLLHKKRYKEALSIFLTALSLDMSNKEKLTKHISVTAARLCGLSEEFQQSLKDMDIYKRMSEAGVELFKHNQCKHCIHVLEAAQTFETNQKGITMRILLTLANAHTSLNQRDHATTLYLECLQLATATHEQLYQTKALVNMASLYLEDGQTHQAIIYYEKLLHLKAELLADVGTADKLPEFWTKELQCGIHLNLSIAYKSIGSMTSALCHAKNYISCLKDFNVTGRTLAESYHNAGMLSEILGHYSEALDYYSQYLNLCQEISNKRGIGQAYGCMGTVYTAMRNWALSISCHEKFIDIAETLSDKRMLATANEMLADSYMIKTDFDAAIKHYESMVNVCAQTDYQTQATGLCKIGNAFRGFGKHQYSIYFYERACDIAKDYAYEDIQIMSEFNIACILQTSTQMSDIGEAERHFKKLIPYYERKITEHKEEDTYCPVEYSEQLQACYDGVLFVLSRLGNKTDSLQYAEAYRKRCVTQLSNFQSTQRPVISHTMLHCDSWTIEKINRIVSQQNGTILYYSLLDSAILLWVLQPGAGIVRFYTGKAEEKMSMKKQVQNLLDEILGDISVDSLRKDCESHALPLPNAQITFIRRQNLYMSGHTENTDSNTSKDEAQPASEKPVSRRLYDLLLSPIEDILAKLDPDSHVLIIPDKELCHCPFGMLQDWNSVCVKDRFHITYLPCLLLLDTVLQNEQEWLRKQDQLKFDRQTARKGGMEKLSAEIKIASRCSEAVSSKSPVNLKQVSNPRLYTSSMILQLNPPKRSTPNGGHILLSRCKKYSEQSPSVPRTSIAHIVEKVPSIERLFGGGTFSTLTTRTSTGTDVTASTRSVPVFQQISSKERCVVYGCPLIQDNVQLHGKPWNPQTSLPLECVEMVAKCLDVDPVVGINATKRRLLEDLQKANIIHIATYGCWTDNKLVLTPNRDVLGEGPSKEESYIVSPADIHCVRMCAQLVVLNTGFNPWRREAISSLSLPASFLAAGTQCVLVTMWQIPDSAMSKFYHHFYMALQDGDLVTNAVNIACDQLRDDDRFTDPHNWSPFILIGKDTRVNISEIRHAMLDQQLDTVEEDIHTNTGEDYLNTKEAVTYVPTKEENFSSLQLQLKIILCNHSRQPLILGNLVDLLDAALKRLHTKENNQQTSRLPNCVAIGTGALTLLKNLGFHFQAVGESLLEPYIVYPHWNKDELLIPAYDALRSLSDLTLNVSCTESMCEILPLSQEHISLLVDLMSITKHASEVQLKVTDLSVQPLWENTKIRAVLVSIGFHQVGLLLNFNNVPESRKLLTALLQLLLAVSCYKSQVLLYRLDVNLLGSPPSISKQTQYSTDVQLKLPSLMPLILPKNQLRMSTPWHSTIERSAEMFEKMKLARGTSDLDEDYKNYTERAKTWHQITVTAQGNEALIKQGRPKTTPRRVKVLSGRTPSRKRTPLEYETTLSIKEVDQRRDYAHFVLQKRLNNIEVRHKDDIIKMYLPYVHG